MNFLRRHFFLSFLAHFVLGLLLVEGMVWAFWTYTDIRIDWLLFAPAALVFIVGGILVLTRLDRPLRAVIREMKALLTGRPYRRILTSRQDEVGIVAHFFNEITRNLENISLEMKSHQRIQKELDSATEIQRLLIPKTTPQVPGLEVSAKTRPASEIGGDTFDFFTKGERHLFFVGDSTGHGIPAGIVMVMVDALFETFVDLKDSMREMLIGLNRYLKPHLKPTMFMTLLFFEWLPLESAFRWVGCGHEYVVHFKATDRSVTALASGGIAIGMLADNSKLVQEKTLAVAPGDFVVLYSDGIVEAKNKTGELYGLERLKQKVAAYAGADVSTEAVFQQIAVDVGQFMDGAPQLDDMTLIVIKVKPTASALPAPSQTEWKA